MMLDHDLASAPRRARLPRSAVAAGMVLLGIAIFSFVGPTLYRTDQVHTSLQTTNLSPRAGHPLGTDENGYDELGRLMEGGQVSIEIGCAVAVVATLFGAAYGAIAGYFSRAYDAVMMRLVDVGLALPVVFVFMFAARTHEITKTLLIIVIAGLAWFGPARLVRGDTLVLRHRDFVRAVHVMGGSSWRAISRHVLPNALGTIVTTMTFLVADAILLLAALDYLGFGLPAPTPAWGAMLSGGVTFLQDGYWWQVFPPLVAIAVTVVSCNALGDALRRAFDARVR